MYRSKITVIRTGKEKNHEKKQMSCKKIENKDLEAIFEMSEKKRIRRRKRSNMRHVALKRASIKKKSENLRDKAHKLKKSECSLKDSEKATKYY